MKNNLSKRIYTIAGLSDGPATAGLIFIILSVCLHLSYLERFSHDDLLFVLLPAVGATGAFLLSKFYVRTFAAAILAGAVYGFCPFVLAFSAYHHFAGLPAALIPWLLMPAMIIEPSESLLSLRNIAKLMLGLLALSVIPLFFYLPSLPSIGPVFPMPLIRPGIQNLSGFVLPLSGNVHEFNYSLYHVPVCAMLFGTLLYLSRGQVMLIIAAALGVAISFSEPFLQTPPIAWGILLILAGSILAGIGAENLVRAKKKFRKLALCSLVIAGGMSVFAFFESQVLSGALFALMAVFIVVIAMVSDKSAKFRFAIWLAFYTGCCADILFGAQHALEQIFGYGF